MLKFSRSFVDGHYLSLNASRCQNLIFGFSWEISGYIVGNARILTAISNKPFLFIPFYHFLIDSRRFLENFVVPVVVSSRYISYRSVLQQYIQPALSYSSSPFHPLYFVCSLLTSTDSSSMEHCVHLSHCNHSIPSFSSLLQNGGPIQSKKISLMGVILP